MIAGALDGLGIDEQGGTVTFHDSFAATVADAALVIENVPEKVEIKAQVYRDLDALIGADVLVATDTSGIPITKLQAHISAPGRFVGMHWSNPPHIIPMIEVMENRVLYALLRECVDLVEQGVIDAKDLDTCVTWGIGYKLSVIGPMRLLDMAGLDIYQSVASFLNAELCDRDDVSPMVTEATAQGRLGMKSGGGLFEYSPEDLARLPRERGTQLVAVRRVLEGKA
jgi:5-formyl-3-hydroxy-2-methylpyridine 4-carboxylate dehydrogenase